MAQGTVFNHLVARIADLFSAYSLHEMDLDYLENAPQRALNLYDFVPSFKDWETQQLASFLTTLAPEHVPAVYGRAPSWVYAALASHARQSEFYQFDHALGWIKPVSVRLSSAINLEIRIFMTDEPDLNATQLTLTFPLTRLEYFQPDPLPFPFVPAEQGIILDGPLPLWLVTALVRLYRDAGVAWIAMYEPRKQGSVVVYSRVSSHQVGDLVSTRVLMLA